MPIDLKIIEHAKQIREILEMKGEKLKNKIK